MARTRKLRARDFTYTASRDGFGVALIAGPLWADWLVGALEGLCVLSGHRWCNARPLTWAIRLQDRVSRRVVLPVDERTARSVYDFMAEVGGWPEREWPYSDDACQG